MPDGPPWPRELETAVEVATEYLWRKTAGRYGLCWELIRPCPAPVGQQEPRAGLAWPDPNGAPSASQWGTGYSAGFGGSWQRSYGMGGPGEGSGGGWFGTCGCGGPCGCGAQPEIVLPGPIWQDMSRDYPHGRQYTVDLFVDGTRLHDSWFRVLDGGFIVPTGGWFLPTFQDLSRPAIPEPGWGPEWMHGTWGIRYWRGLPVPSGGIQAVTNLACEMWKACGGWGECRLPKGMIDSVEREGISYKLVDPEQDMLANLPMEAGWVASVNPYNIKEQSYVVSPDLPRYHAESRRSRVWNPIGRGWR